MSKSRLIVSLVFTVALMIWTGQLAAGWWPLQAAPRVVVRPLLEAELDPAPAPTQKSQRAPIRVGNAVQAAKLSHRVQPVFPEKAREARLQGIVLLQVLVDESGIVEEIKILRGHPLLNDAAVEAVSQWRYSPTTLEGEPVPVLSNVEVFMTPGRVVTLDAEGSLRDPQSELTGETLIDELSVSEEQVVLWPGSGASFESIELTMRMLQDRGLQNLSLRSPFRFHGGRLFYSFNYGGIEKPEIALEEEVLKELALASGLMEDIRPEKDGSKLLLYTLYVNEVSEIIDVIRLRGPEIPEVVEELYRTPVITPGRRGMNPVPVFFHVEVRIN